MITILCSGSRGDIQPYVALAVAIQKQGHAVRVAAGVSFADFITSYGVEHYSLATDYKSTDVDPKLLEAAANSTNPLKMALTFNKMKKYARIMVDEMYEACQGSELIIYHPGCTIGYFAAEEMGIPSIMASPFPMLATNEYASVVTYGKFKVAPKVSYKLLQKLLWTASETGVKLFWREKYGQLPANFGAPFERVDAKHPSFASCSNYIFPRPKDWPEAAYQFGYWFTEETNDYQPPQAVSDFLAQGEKPIYFGFGSVFAEKDQAAFVATIREALAQTGERGIICGMGAVENLPANILAIDNIPHTWLFPRCRAVCHHGGSGTAAAGFAAGVPSIIVPFSNDQFAWAHRAFDLGVGARPIYKKKFTTQRLVAAIEATRTPTMTTAAQTLGANLATETGAEDCAKVVSLVLTQQK